MDIEGSEYKVLPKMIEDGSIKYINTLIIEWHNWQLPQYDELTNLLFSEIPSLGIQVMGWG
jgi:hydrogenase maturation factor HypE